MSANPISTDIIVMQIQNRQPRMRAILLCLIASLEILHLHFANGQDTIKPTLPKPGEVNTQFSRIYVFVDKLGVAGHQHAVEGKLKSGELFSSGDAGSLVFDMTTFDADGANARKYLGLEGDTDAATRKKVNENMLGNEILAVKQYPEARLENAMLKATGKQSNRNLPEYVLEGDFVLHKTKRHVQIRCDMEIKEGWNHLRGAFKILQSDYGIKPFSKLFGAVGVKDELMIVGDLWIAPSS